MFNQGGLMKGLVASVAVGAMVLGGCTGPDLKLGAKGGFYNLQSSSTGAFDPSLKTLITFACVPEEGHYESVKIDDDLAECHGRFVVLDKNQAQQSGYMTGVFSSAIQGGAFVGGMYLLGNGIGKSGSTTNNNNDTSSDAQSTGGTGVSSSTAVAEGGTSHASQSQQSNPQQFQNNTQNPVINNKTYNKSSSSSVSKNHNSNMIGGD